MNQATLQFDDVTFPDDDYYDGGIKGVTLQLYAGEMAMIRTEPGHILLPIADLAQGLVAATGGSVTYAGESWDAMRPDRATEQRASTRRVFAGAGWISNLDVDENVTLAERHFSKRTEKDIQEEADALAAEFGLDQLPRARPAWVKQRDLIVAGWIRALLGKPKLILLEHPCRDAYADRTSIFIKHLQQRRDEGATVVWLTAEERIWSDKGIESDQRLQMRGEELRPA